MSFSAMARIALRITPEAGDCEEIGKPALSPSTEHIIGKAFLSSPKSKARRRNGREGH
jgi:hypothetical protein